MSAATTTAAITVHSNYDKTTTASPMPTKSYIDLSELSPPVLVPNGYSNDLDNLTVSKRFSGLTGSVTYTINKYVNCIDIKPFLYDQKGVYYIHAIDRNDPSKSLFFSYNNADFEVEKQSFYLHTKAADVHEFVAELAQGKGEEMRKELLLEWLDRLDRELFEELPKMIGVRNGSSYWR
jgi:hypothetical protein